MAKLPKIQPRGAVTRGPQSSVSPAEVANPFQQIANAFDGVGQFYQAKTDDDARIEGENGVTRDADGNLKVELRSNITQANRIYNRSVTQSFAAQSEIDAKAAMSRFQLEARGNPETFAAAAKAYRDQRMIAMPKELRGPVGAMLDSEARMGYEGVQSQKYKSDMMMSKSTLLESIAMKDDERGALARQGGIETPEYQQRFEETRTLWNELSTNPVFGISPKEAELKIKQAMSRDKAEAMLGEADKAIESGGVEAARKLADRILVDPNLSFSPAERRQYAGLIHQTISGYRAEQRAAIEPFKDLAKDRVKLWDAGTSLDSPDDDELISNIRKGDPAYASYLRSRLATARQVRDIRNLSDGDQAALLAQSGSRGGVIEKIVGAESGGNNAAQNPNSSAGGAGQFIDSTWLAMVKRYRPDVASGKTAGEIIALKSDGALSREMTGRYAQENASFLRNQGVPITDANVYLAHFLGPRGAAQIIKADPSASVESIVGQDVVRANGFLAGKSVADLRAWSEKKMGGGSSPLTGEAAKTLQAEVTADLKEDLGDWKTRLLKGDIPDQESLNLMSRQLALVDDQDLRNEYAGLFRQSEAFQRGYRDNPAAAEAFLGSLGERAAEQGATIAELEVIDSYRAGTEAAAIAKKNDGLGYAMRAYPGFPEMPPLDVNNPASYADTLRRYQGGVNLAEARGEMNNLSAFRPAQADAVARMWQTADPRQLSALTDAMASSLSPKTLRATLTDKPIKEALTGAILSTDPVKHSTAMQQLDLLSSQVSMPELEAGFGKDAVDRLQDWQAKVRYFTPDETTEWLKQRNDPRWQDRTKPLVTKGEAEARKVSAASVVDKLDSNAFWDAEGPQDTLTQRAMLNDFVTLTGDRNASLDDVDKAQDQAIERMRKRWGVTSVYGTQGGRLMPYPPEQFLPQVSGSHDWIGREMESIAAARGVPITSLSLVPDRKTEAAIQRGEEPGYMISIVDPATGLQEMMSDEQGRPLRHFFDSTGALKTATGAASEARRTRNDPWAVFGRGTAIGPLYLGGADPADLANREQRIGEIVDERESRMEKKRATRQKLKDADIPGLPKGGQ